MFENLVVEYCAPTMAGLKTGNLFTCPRNDDKQLAERLRIINRSLVPHGIRLIPLKFYRDRVLLYMYRPDRLDRDLRDGTAQQILSERNYPCADSEKCLVKLRRQLAENKDFPHEIGLFLGYPSEDVEGFISHGAKDAKCVGIWKVYGDRDAAEKKFAAYRKCTRLYCDAYKKHRSLDRLLVG